MKIRVFDVLIDSDMIFPDFIISNMLILSYDRWIIVAMRVSNKFPKLVYVLTKLGRIEKFNTYGVKLLQVVGKGSTKRRVLQILVVGIRRQFNILIVIHSRDV